MKKKIILNLLLLFTCFFVFDSVKADMGAPETAKYDVIVKNIAGAEAKLYNSEIKDYEIVTIPYDTKLTVIMEHKSEIDDEWYGFVNYDNKSGNIKLKDVDLVDKQFSLEKAIHLNSHQEVIIINKDGAYLYAGPSKTYQVVSDKIPTGTTLKYEYVDTNNKVWAYVEYNGVNGWLYIYNMDLGPYGLSYAIPTSSDSNIYTVKENIVIYDYPTKDSNVLLDKANVDDKISCKYSFQNNPYSAWCYTKYNGVEGWLFFSPYGGSIAMETRIELMTFEENGLTLFSDLDETSSSHLNVEKYAILKPNYIWSKDKSPAFGSYYYIDYNGQKGWIKSSEKISISYSTSNYLYAKNTGIPVYDSFECNNRKSSIAHAMEFTKKFTYDGKSYVEYNNTSGWILESDLKSSDYLWECKNCEITLDKDVNIYSKWLDDSEILGKINGGETLKTKFSPFGEENNKWYYVEYDGIKGWINTNVEYVVSTEQEETNQLIEQIEKEVPKNSLPPHQIILLCVGGAVIIALTTFVVIVLINKNKKQKQQVVEMPKIVSYDPQTGQPIYDNDSQKKM